MFTAQLPATERPQMRPEILDDVHGFWFGALHAFHSFNEDRLALWFGGNQDAEIGERFLAALGQADNVVLDPAALTRTQQVGLVVLFDQMPRNMFRGKPRSYAFDEKARSVVRSVTADGLGPFKLVERAFLTICLGHSEHLADQEAALRYYVDDIAPFAPEGNSFYEAGRIQTAKYLDIIRRFGRFPHRNVVLKRQTTEDEARFMAEHAIGPF